MSDDDKKQIIEEEEEVKDLNGPLDNRSCTDVIFLVLFIVFLVGMGVITRVAVLRGNVDLLIRGYDSYGNICGKQNEPIEGIELSGQDMTSKPYLFYLNPRDLATPAYVKAVCVDRCPSQIQFDLSEETLKYCLYGTLEEDMQEGVNCPNMPVFGAVAILFRCVPNTLMNHVKSASTEATKISNSLGDNPLQTAAAEVETGRNEIVYICLIGIGFSFLILLLIRFLASLFVYVVYALAIVGSIGGTTYLWVTWHKELTFMNSLNNTSGDMNSDAIDDMESNVEALHTYSIIATIATAILLLVMLAMWSRLKLVIALFKEASAVVMAMPLIVLQPFFTLIFVGGFLIYWVVALLFIASCKSPQHVITRDGVFIEYVDDQWNERAFWYHLFGLFWVTQFLIAIQLMTIAGAVTAWYFTRNKDDLGWFPLVTATYRALRYHLGTLALGSLIIAVVQFIQAVLAYIQAKLEASGNVVASFILKGLMCCMWCLEKFLKYVNRNAYIMTAIYGYSFCRAAMRGFSLLLSNAMRVAAINTVGDFCLFLAKLVVIIVTGVIGLEICKTDQNLKIDAIPVTIGVVFTYVIAHVFLSVYEMIVDTIFLCFCEDSSRNNGGDKPYYMSDNLKEFVETSEKALEDEKTKKEEKQALVNSEE